MFCAMSEFPKVWGWTTIVSGGSLVGFVVWRLNVTLGSKRRRKIAATGIISLLLLFFFSFMQWASWYK
jgi:CHASE2 domain-containing sensor protein